MLKQTKTKPSKQTKKTHTSTRRKHKYMESLSDYDFKSKSNKV